MKAEGRIEITTFAGQDLPEVKIFGTVEVKDVGMLPMAIRRAVFEYFNAQGKENLALLEAKRAEEEKLKTETTEGNKG